MVARSHYRVCAGTHRGNVMAAPDKYNTILTNVVTVFPHNFLRLSRNFLAFECNMGLVLL